MTDRSEAMFRMTPEPRSAIQAPNAWLQRKAPVRPTCSSRFHCSSLKFSRREVSTRPSALTLASIAALFTRTSTARCRSRVRRNPSRTLTGSPTSRTRAFAQSRRTAAVIPCAVRAAALWSMSARTTVAPTSASASACCSPSKPPPPVTTATLPLRSNMAGRLVLIAADPRPERRMRRSRRSHAAKPGKAASAPLRRLFLPHRAGEKNVSGRERVDPDSLTRQGSGGVLHEAVERRFRRPVAQRTAKGLHAADGGDAQHDALGLRQHLPRSLHDMQRREQVDVEQAAPLRLFGLPSRRRAAAADVAYQYVELFVSFAHCGRHSARPRDGSHVPGGDAACRADGTGGGVQPG